MAEAGTIADVGTAGLADLDWDYRPPCDIRIHPTHHVPSQPAMFLIFSFHACGGRTVHFLICESGWEWFGVHGAWCRDCGSTKIPRAQCMRIVHVLGD